MKKAVLVVLGLAAFFGLLAYMTADLKRERVQVCMSHRGAQNCATVSAATRDQALRTAMENACATISAGMTDSRECETTPPVSVKWLSGQ